MSDIESFDIADLPSAAKSKLPWVLLFGWLGLAAIALALAHALPDPQLRAGELLIIGAELPEPERAEAVREVWGLAQTAEPGANRAALLGQAARLLRDTEQPAALQVALHSGQ